MGQIKDNRKCIWSSTFIFDTEVVFSTSELVLNISDTRWVSVTLRGYAYFPSVTWRVEPNMSMCSLQATLNWKGVEASIWWGQGKRNYENLRCLYTKRRINKNKRKFNIDEPGAFR